MIHIDRQTKVDHAGVPMADCLKSAKNKKEKIAAAIEVVKKLPIHGCITGSCFLPNFDPDAWGSTPDIDVFVYSEADLIRSIELAQRQLKMKPGTGSDRSKAQEEWKIQRLFDNGVNRKTGISTYKFSCDGIVLNFTYKEVYRYGRKLPCYNVQSVLESFDMSIVMQGYDIEHHAMHDMRPDDVPENVAVPNPLRKQDCMMWTVAKWVRQFDRVVKYYNRGYDTRPMAKFYLDMIDECIEAGCLFDSEESTEAFERFGEEFLEKRRIIADWYDEHKED